VESGIAKSVELHNHIDNNGVMEMRQVPSIEIKSKGEAQLKPGGYHVMLMDLKQQMKEGDIVPVTLVIEGKDKKRTTVELKAPVKPLATAPSKMEHEHKH
jgi:copper(I)-binding protein